jgi:hypothetical protein
VSYRGYEEATLFNALAFAVASGSGQVLLRRLYRPLIARDVRHRALLRLWLIIYAFVGIQMGWLLRPSSESLALPPAFCGKTPGAMPTSSWPAGSGRFSTGSGNVRI